MSDNDIRLAIAAGRCDDSIDEDFRRSQDCIAKPCCLDIFRGTQGESTPCAEYVEGMVEPIFMRLVPLFARAEKAVAQDPQIDRDARLLRELRRVSVEELCRVDLDLRRLGIKRPLAFAGRTSQEQRER